MFRNLLRTDPALVVLYAILAFAVVMGGGATLAFHLAAMIIGSPQNLPWNPFVLALNASSNKIQWPTSTVVLALAFIVFLLVVIISTVLVIVSRKKGKRGDDADRRGIRDFKVLGRKQVASKSARLGVDSPGLPLGYTLKGTELMTGWEEVMIDIWGPRTGKTTTRAIPLICSAPGATVITSNKPDVLYPPLANPNESATLREAIKELRGGQVWVFDPQQIAVEPQTWWWDPLSFVKNAVDAVMLAEIFVDAGRDPNASKSAFFDDASIKLLAAMILAAAKYPQAMVKRGQSPSRVPITKIYDWLSNETDDEPVMILKDAGENTMATSLRGVIDLVPETRSGVYGGAANMASFIINADAMKWVTPGSGYEFHPEEFVKSKDTLYLFSQEGPGSAAPIMTALTIAVTQAAIEEANRLGGRLPTPMTVILDEAANVCRWRRLPDMYSFYGSKGIVVDTILQSWSQGVAAWGNEGMRKLWSAANVRVYGGGVGEKDFLSDLSEIIGDYYVDSTQISHGTGNRSVSTTVEGTQRKIATIADLASLPSGRAWVFAHGARPTLMAPTPWWEGPHARVINSHKRKVGSNE